MLFARFFFVALLPQPCGCACTKNVKIHSPSSYSNGLREWVLGMIRNVSYPARPPRTDRSQELFFFVALLPRSIFFLRITKNESKQFLSTKGGRRSPQPGIFFLFVTFLLQHCPILLTVAILLSLSQFYCHSDILGTVPLFLQQCPRSVTVPEEARMLHSYCHCPNILVTLS